MSTLPDYLTIPPRHLGQGTPVRVRLRGDMADIARDMAREMSQVLAAARTAGHPATLIVPVGPVDQFPLLAHDINHRRLDCRDVVFINMDEYLTNDDQWISLDHPLSFRAFMKTLFRYAGSRSLQDELDPIAVTEVAPGDVFVQGGFPGHAVLVVDVAQRRDGTRVFMLAQSYMPAQEIHVLKNPRTGEAWFEAAPHERFETPEWSFPPDSLRRFPERD